ncbi:hypothetical protein [Thiobacter aerophilum]|uniref:Uncharacterized protein n=1 Tax=Thiobacter aerophilum TaxID=3121275 RepID=A0ABV0EF43_9BURK
MGHETLVALDGCGRLRPLALEDAPDQELAERSLNIRLARFAGRPELARTEKSLSPYAFSEIEEAGITQRLLSLAL